MINCQTIILQRSDLSKSCQTDVFEYINLNSFFISRDIIHKSEIILFMDELGNTKMLKNKFGKSTFSNTF